MFKRSHRGGLSKYLGLSLLSSEGRDKAPETNRGVKVEGLRLKCGKLRSDLSDVFNGDVEINECG